MKSLRELIDSKGVSQRFLAKKFDVTDTVMSLLVKYEHVIIKARKVLSK